MHFTVLTDVFLPEDYGGAGQLTVKAPLNDLVAAVRYADMDFKNRAKKLDVVLRRMTGDTMTQEQRQRLQYALGYRRQYRLRLCKSDCDFKQAVSPEQVSAGSRKSVRMLLGENSGMLAALVSNRQSEGSDNTVYLYLPNSKEALRDERQEEDVKEA